MNDRSVLKIHVKKGFFFSRAMPWTVKREFNKRNERKKSVCVEPFGMFGHCIKWITSASVDVDICNVPELLKWTERTKNYSIRFQCTFSHESNSSIEMSTAFLATRIFDKTKCEISAFSHEIHLLFNHSLSFHFFYREMNVVRFTLASQNLYIGDGRDKFTKQRGDLLCITKWHVVL